MKPIKAYAVVDPSWGDPRPILATLATSADEAWDAAERLPNLALYSGASAYPLPRGTAGSRENLLRAGFKMGLFDLTPRETAK